MEDEVAEMVQNSLQKKKPIMKLMISNIMRWAEGLKEDLDMEKSSVSVEYSIKIASLYVALLAKHSSNFWIRILKKH